MSGTNNRMTFAKGVRAQLEKRYDVIQERAEKYCDVVVNEAIRSRESAPGKHDFTGNFLNGIVVVLYRDDNPVYASYAYTYVKPASHSKMTRLEQGFYHFNKDYEGIESSYVPQVVTDEGYGRDDAIQFAHSYRPKHKAKLSIVCAYTTEYSNFVEFQNHTSGVMRSYEWVEREARVILGGVGVVK